MPDAPLVTVLLAVRDGGEYVRTAVESALGQTLSDLEVLVVDDASSDATPTVLEGIADSRLRVLRNERAQGLAGSLNRGLDEARGRYVARLDADDVALPRRLEHQLVGLRTGPPVGITGSAVLELDEQGRVGRPHAMSVEPTEVRWSALFGAPFYHPTVMVDRDLLDGHSLRYDTSFEESEDYDLWSRLLEHTDGANLLEPLVLYRVHPDQASQRRGELQRECQLRVARAAIANAAPALSAEDVDRAWRVGAAEPVSAGAVYSAASAYLALLEAFEERWGRGARARSARDLVRLSGQASAQDRARLARHALRLDPGLPAHVLERRRERRRMTLARREAEGWLIRLAGGEGAGPIRVACVFPEPTPYRTPLLDRIAALPEIDLTVLYAARTVAGHTWRIEPAHRTVHLRGLRLPGAERLVRHDYPITPGVVGALFEARPQVVVVSGWSTFAAQAAIAWCELQHVPFVLVVESHDEGPRPGWRRAVKGTVVPPVVQRAASVLVTGTLARDSMLARGAAPERVHLFANTVDVEEFAMRAEWLMAKRDELRRRFGAGLADVVVLCVARLGAEKRIDVLVRAVASADDPNLLLALAGDGPQRQKLVQLAGELGVRLAALGDVDWERIVELYVAADVFALLSERETWAVVVNEAAACGLPLVLSDRMGAAHDLLRDGDNGTLVPSGDVETAARALRELARDPELRRAQGDRSRELARDWGYGPSVDGFLEAVREAVANRVD